MNRLLKLLRIIAVPRFAWALLRGCAPTVEHEPILRSRRFRFIVDVGANRGQFAILARQLAPSAVIHSVEPLAEPARVLEELMRGDSGFFLHRCAVGSRRGSARMHVSAQDYSSSLLLVGSHMREAFPGIIQREVREISVVELDDLIDARMMLQPALLKIDVQGYELEVLRGCGDLLCSFAAVLLECAFVELYQGQPLAAEVIQFMHAAGFRVEGVYDTFYSRSGMPIQADFLFVPNVQSG